MSAETRPAGPLRLPSRQARGGGWAALLLAALLCAAGSVPAVAAERSAVVEMRIEGRTSTLFEGPLRTEGHDVRASSDTVERTCDGTNDARNREPGPTPTAAAADAMALDSQSFDGRWSSGFEDYLITRWGSEGEGEGESWSLFDNDALANVGGCQLELGDGAQVLWKLGLPTARPLLMLAPRGTTSATPPLTARAEPGVPLEVEVIAYRPAAESEPPAEPTRLGASAFAGAKVAPVQTSAQGVESTLGESPAAVTTNPEGIASITFATAGWHRLKAIGSGAVRSNRLDVCVAEGGAGCGTLPPEDEVRSVSPPGETPPVSVLETPSEHPVASSEAGADGTSTTSPSAPSLSVAAAAATNTLRLDGRTLVPIDDRSRSLRLTGPWSRRADRGAWDGTVSLGARGARFALTLGAGRPALVLRDMSAGATVLCVSGGVRRRLALAAIARNRSRLVLLSRRDRSGRVELLVLHGRIGLDGVALLP